MDALLELLLQHWPGVLFRQRPDLTFEVASPQLEPMTGYALEEWKTQPELFWKVIHELDVDLVKQHLEEVAAEAEGKSCSFRVRHRTTGRVAYISEFRRALRDESGGLRSYEGFWTDVTQQALAERRLATAAWKETLGLLTLGLSHDFNNLLAGIMGLSEAYLTQIDQAHPFREGLSLVTRNTRQAAQLIQRIAQLHRGKTGTRGYHDLNALVTEGVELLGKVIPRRIEVSSDLASGQLPLYVDPVDFQHAMISLALNAADAMPERGRMVIRTFETTTWPEAPNFAGAPPRLPAACFELTDTGHGIKTRHLPFIFDPFFTTKPMNCGSGLGLHNAKLFMEKHGGMISVETQEGKGATFRLWFPVADFTEADEALELSNRRRRSLLLVGHQGASSDATAELLRMNNYHVVIADRDADELLQSSDYQFDGVFILAEPNDPQPLQAARYVRAQKLPLKVILKTVGINPDELEPDLVLKCDLLLSPDMSEDTILDKLAATFDLRGRP